MPDPADASPAGPSPRPPPAPPAAKRPAPAVAASVDRAAGRRRARLRGLRQGLPALVVSGALHLGAAWAASLWLLSIAVEPPPTVLQASVADVDSVELVEEPPPDEPLPPEEPDPAPPDVTLYEPEPPPDADDRAPSEELDVLGLGASGVGGRGFRRGGDTDWGVPAGADLPGRGDSPFQGYIDDLRRRGLDVVFVVDATGSMQRFIDRARETIDDVIQDLATVVPSLRIGLVAYRDLGDDWVTQRTDLTTDRYRIHNFLLGLRAAGGRRETPDFEEAVEEGLRVAAEELDWRDGARRVLVLVGDAPYHEEDQAAALATVRSFARGEHAVVNTVYVWAGELAQPTRNQQNAREVMERIANTGRGEAFELRVDDPSADEALRISVTRATFDDEWLPEIRALQASGGRDGRLASIERHVARRDRRWLVRRMSATPIHPAVAAACRDLFDARIAVAMLRQLEDLTNEPALRTAALYVLQAAIEDVRDIAYDVYLPAEEQTAALATIRHRVRQVPGAAAILDGKEADVPPAPGTPGAGAGGPGVPPPAGG